MSHVLPLPHRSSLAVPLAALAIGAASGLAAGVIVADDGVSVPGSAPAAQVSGVPSSTPPVPERVASSLSGTTSSSTPAVPERISGARGR